MKAKKIEEYDITMPFYEIRISVTGACNQNCIYCGPFTDGKYDKGYANLSLPQVKAFANDLKDIIKESHLHIQLTGGEPMLREDLSEIVKILKKKGIRDIGITTNGSVITPAVSLHLIKSGLTDFHIHIPSLNLAAYVKTVRRKFDNSRIKNILESAKTIKNEGARVEFNTPVTRINLATISKLLDFCFENKINLKLIEELGLGSSRVSVPDIKKIVIRWLKRKRIVIEESRIENRYGLIYQFSKDFFFRIAPVSDEFQTKLLGKNKKILLDGRYWVGGRNNKFLFTPSYFIDPIEGTIKDLKKQLKSVSKKYDKYFINHKK